ALTLSGTTLYGMTNSGGNSPSVGTIFKINVDGTGYAILHDFNAGTTDGGNPYGQLLLSGSTLYGMTHGGGSASNNGTVFKIDTSGNNFSIIHSFAGGSADGSHPHGGLAISGNTLFGMTPLGGADQGTLFKVNTDGGGLGLVHTFTVS